jgi:anthranilate synthase component 1
MRTAPTLSRTTLHDLRAARIAAGGPCRAPVVRSLPADLHTPVGAYLRLRSLCDHNFLLESVEGGETLARYSFVGARPKALLRAWGRRVELEADGRVQTLDEDPRDTLRRLCGGLPLVETPGLPRFLGGAVGFFSYDSVRLQEDVPRSNPDPLGTPDLDLGLYDELVAFDHVASLLHLVEVVEVRDDAEAVYADAVARLDELEALLVAPLGDVPSGSVDGAPVFESNIDQATFEAAVRRAQEHILAGDIFQGVLSRRLSADLNCDPFAVYRALRMLNPSPYLFYFELGEHTLVGASPEMLVRVHGGVVETLPIAGTRARGATEAEDRALEAELLVDLGRNDIGRVSAFGSVEVVEHLEVHRFSHVMHLVSRVRGRLREGCDALDALYACFPAGTVSGAPKVRAMHIIEELEPTARGVYAGAVGWLDYRGDLDTCIAIRTAIVRGGRIHVQAGAGIVYDSVPHLEYEETANKARALIEAVRQAEGGALR